MNKIVLILALSILFSCNKEKRSDKYLAGDWSIVNYSEIIFDGTTNKYDLISGSAHFDDLRGKSEANFALDVYATSINDTVEHKVSGIYSRRSLDKLEFKINDSIYLFDINRIFKNDLNLQGGLVPDRKGIYIMKKK